MKKVSGFLTIAIVLCTVFALTGCSTKSAKLTIEAVGFTCTLENDGFESNYLGDCEKYYSIKDSDGEVVAVIVNRTFPEENFNVVSGSTFTIFLSLKYNADSIVVRINNNQYATTVDTNSPSRTVEIGGSTFSGKAIDFEIRDIFKDSVIKITGFTDSI